MLYTSVIACFDASRYLKLCNFDIDILHEIEADENFLKRVIFSDEF